jgi:transcriptional regulator GlxA family with amidase domain
MNHSDESQQNIIIWSGNNGKRFNHRRDQIWTALLHEFTKEIPDPSELDMQYRRLKQIKPAITYMESHLADKSTLENLSEVAHLSPIHFSRVFKTVSGFSPMEFLGRLRVQKASQLLVNTDKTIVEIARKIYKKKRPIKQTAFIHGNPVSQ